VKLDNHLDNVLMLYSKNLMIKISEERIMISLSLSISLELSNQEVISKLHLHKSSVQQKSLPR